jgi:hypothetical protein
MTDIDDEIKGQREFAVELRSASQVRFDAAMSRAREWWKTHPGEIYPCQCATCTAYRESKADDHG